MTSGDKWTKLSAWAHFTPVAAAKRRRRATSGHRRGGHAAVRRHPRAGDATGGRQGRDDDAAAARRRRAARAAASRPGVATRTRTRKGGEAGHAHAQASRGAVGQRNLRRPAGRRHGRGVGARQRWRERHGHADVVVVPPGAQRSSTARSVASAATLAALSGSSGDAVARPRSISASAKRACRRPAAPRPARASPPCAEAAPRSRHGAGAVRRSRRAASASASAAVCRGAAASSAAPAPGGAGRRAS